MRPTLALLSSGIRWASSEASTGLRFCVVGSGPAGFYTVDKILKRFGENTTVDIVEGLPTPFGLVRSGVAPDHPDTKNVINQFSTLSQDPRISFFGNVRVGSPAISLTELRSLYNGVVLAYGAEADRQLNIPGEDLSNVFSAREFVWWYNGHPQYTDLPVDISTVNSVAVTGLGNVAVDCARLLLRSPEDLSKTDITSHAVRALQSSAVKEVHLLGRRGPAQAAFTPKELRELTSLSDVKVCVWPKGVLELSATCQGEIAGNRIKRRVVEVLTKAEKEDKPGATKTLNIHFLKSPIAITPSPTNPTSAGGLTLQHMLLQPTTDSAGVCGSQKAIPTDTTEHLDAQIILKSIGYRSVAIDGAPFDPKQGIIPNTLGAVGGEKGLFVCGWLKRGPSGIIGTNLVDAEQTVDTMVRIQEELPAVQAAIGGTEGLKLLLKERGVEVVDWSGWRRIDEEEKKGGGKVGKPREKFVCVEDMLRIAAASSG